MSREQRNTRPQGFGPPGGRLSLERPKDFKGALRKIAAYIGKHKIAVALVMLFAAGSTVFTINGPKILSEATTLLYTGLAAKVAGTGGIDFTRIGQILLRMLIVYAGASLFDLVQGLLMAGVTQKVTLRMRNQISEKIHRMPMGYFEKNTVGEVLSRITNDVDTMGQSLNQSLGQLIRGVTTIIGVLYMMFSISPLMTLIALVILPISALLIRAAVKRSQKYFRAQQEELGVINGQVEETFGGLAVVQAYGRQQKSLEEFTRTNQKLYEAAWKTHFFAGLMPPVMTFVGNLGYVGVAVSGSLLAIRGAITVGDILAFIQYVRNFTQPISQTAQVLNMLQSMTAAAERVFAFLAEDEAEQPDDETAPRRPDVAGRVSFDHVSFGYTPGVPVIKDFTCEIEPGQTVAIVGPTGAGKTTVVKLLMRFYDVDSGAIRVDGKDIRDMDRGMLRRSFGMVLQDAWLFKGTILENIRYGRLDATDEEVMAAARAAYADRFIQSLPGGYQMELNEETSNISQGQKQLLTIARAILADSPVMILDEATSSVDTRTETRIQRAMVQLMKGRTSFVIAHRLSTIRDADVILVMHDGDIVEQGTHKDLLARGGYYAQLYQAQFAPAAG